MYWCTRLMRGKYLTSRGSLSIVVYQQQLRIYGQTRVRVSWPATLLDPLRQLLVTQCWRAPNPVEAIRLCQAPVHGLSLAPYSTFSIRAQCWQLPEPSFRKQMTKSTANREHTDFGSAFVTLTFNPTRRRSPCLCLRISRQSWN